MERLSLRRKARIGQQVLNELLHPCRAVHGKADKLVCLVAELPFVATRQELRIACDHSERLLQVVRGHISEQFELCVGARQLFCFVGKFLFPPLTLTTIQYHALLAWTPTTG